MNDAGWSSLVARRAHNPKVEGSNPSPATKYIQGLANRQVPFLLLRQNPTLKDAYPAEPFQTPGSKNTSGAPPPIPPSPYIHREKTARAHHETEKISCTALSNIIYNGNKYITMMLNETITAEYSITFTEYFRAVHTFQFSFHSPIAAHARYRENVSLKMHRNNQSSQGIHMRRQVVTDMRVPNSVWKKRVSDTLHELNIIPENFSGKVVISFKEGGVSYIEKTETLK